MFSQNGSKVHFWFLAERLLSPKQCWAWNSRVDVLLSHPLCQTTPEPETTSDLGSERKELDCNSVVESLFEVQRQNRSLPGHFRDLAPTYSTKTTKSVFTDDNMTGLGPEPQRESMRFCQEKDSGWNRTPLFLVECFISANRSCRSDTFTASSFIILQRKTPSYIQ